MALNQFFAKIKGCLIENIKKIAELWQDVRGNHATAVSQRAPEPAPPHALFLLFTGKQLSPGAEFCQASAAKSPDVSRHEKMDERSAEIHKRVVLKRASSTSH